MRIASGREAGLAPVAPEERVLSLDVLRGLALFGILIVNILVYAPKPSSAGDWATAKVISISAEGSFYPLFSLLFGVGFAVFLDRAASRGGNGVVLYVRRVIALLAIAVLQIILLDEQNILVRYAFLALPLLLFWRASARVCFGAALICMVLAVMRSPVNQGLSEGEMRDPVLAGHAREQRAAGQARVWARRAEWQRVKATHSFLEAAAFRMRWQVPNQLAWSMNLRRNPTLFHILAMFLLGAAAWRARVFVEPHKYRRLMIHLFGWGLVVGLAGNLALNIGPRGDSISFFASRPIITIVVTLVADTGLALSYASAVMLLWSSGRTVWRRSFAPLAWIGRMGLTNYLWQSVAMSLLFLPYGFGLEDKLPYWAYPLIAVPIFLSHIPLSEWWLARYRFGPVEWLWRTATYARVQPMRLSRRSLESTDDEHFPDGRSTA
jgi:uncharacterized protein